LMGHKSHTHMAKTLFYNRQTYIFLNTSYL